MEDFGGFEHNRQSLRIVDFIERRYETFRGLNLTDEVREGLARHLTEYDDPMPPSSDEEQPTMEAQMVNLADEIAYSNHDLDDGLTSGLLDFDDLEGLTVWDHFLREASQDHPEGGKKLWHYAVVRKIINLLITDAVETTLGNIADKKIAGLDDVRSAEIPLVLFSGKVGAWYKELKNLLLDKMYNHHRVLRMQAKAERIIRELFEEYVTRIEVIPPPVRRAMDGEPPQRIACDYIAGMTDRFALEEYRRLFDPYTRV
jgi:dGTPase